MKLRHRMDPRCTPGGPPAGRDAVDARRLAAVVVAVLLGTSVLMALVGPAGAGESQAEGDPEVPRSRELTPGSPAAVQEAANQDPEMVAAGEQLYLTACVSCHGVGGRGSATYPSLIGAGAASANFYLRTGRMPMMFPAPQAPQKPVAYTDEQIIQLVAYVASLGDGPPIPDVRPDEGNLAEGGELYLSNCAACHNSSGIGGALSRGNHAPPLLDVAAQQLAEAPRIGPGQMPVFGPDTLTDEQLDSVVRYILYLQNPDNPGGLRIGAAGPVPEGLVSWLVGLGALILAIRWITRERPTGRREHG
jgi:ubiquinol-cytochrome c reductase cytochrome c subunit